MRIRMLSTQRGSEDGARVRTFVQGHEYEMAPTPRGRELGVVFVREGWAEEVGSPKPQPIAPPVAPAPAPAEVAPAEVAEDPKPEPQPEPAKPRRGKGR